MKTAFEVDARFIRQVYVLTIILTVLVSAVLLVFNRAVVPSFLIGSAISLSVFWSIAFTVRRLIRPGKSLKTKYVLSFIAFGKYIVLGVCLFLLFKAKWLNYYALGGGIALTQIAIIFKAVGLMVGILTNKDSESQ